jgi:predicted P-loop ATPase
MTEDKDLLKEVEKIHSNIGNDTTKQTQAFAKICGMLANENETPVRLMLINEIAKKYKYTKKDISASVSDLIKKRNAKAKDEQEATTLIDIQEKAIASNFDIHFNEISLSWKIIDYETNTEVTSWDVLRKLKKNNVKINENDLKIILKSNFILKVNPIRDYFEMLPSWDGETDHIAKFTNYIQVNDADRLRFEIQFRKALIRCIACSLEVDFNKHCFIFVGDGLANQNTGKTSLIRYLVPPSLRKYYLEDLPSDGKDSLRGLAENFIINIDELEGLYRTEKNKLKSIFSKDNVKVRIQYDRNWSTIKRRANFWASTNETEFLTDLTGNVRWIVFKLAPVPKPINWDYSTDSDTDINKIWAQAYHLFKSGEAYKLTNAEIIENEKANEQFLSLPAEYDILVTYYSPANSKEYDGFYTTTDLLNAINRKTDRNIKMNAVSLGRTLRKLGYAQGSGFSSATPTKSNSPIKGYFLKINDAYERNQNKENRVNQQKR